MKARRLPTQGATIGRPKRIIYSLKGNGPSAVHDGNGTNVASRHPFDLEERTARFGEAIIRLCKKITRSPVNDRLIAQLVGCGTSAGANYCEANGRASKKDFLYSISRCKKEAHETKFFPQDDRDCRAVACKRSSITLPRSERASLDFCFDFPKRPEFIIR